MIALKVPIEYVISLREQLGLEGEAARRHMNVQQLQHELVRDERLSPETGDVPDVLLQEARAAFFTARDAYAAAIALMLTRHGDQWAAGTQQRRRRPLQLVRAQRKAESVDGKSDYTREHEVIRGAKP